MAQLWRAYCLGAGRAARSLGCRGRDRAAGLGAAQRQHRACGQQQQVLRAPCLRLVHGGGSGGNSGGGGGGGGGGVDGLFDKLLQGSNHEYSETKILGYSPDKVYAVVADIDAYKTFLPWILESRVLNRQGNRCEARLEVGFSAIRESYVSQVTFKENLAIHARASDTNLFKNLVNRWTFREGPKDAHGLPTCRVHIEVLYEFQQPLHGLLASAASDKVVRQMIRAFEQRLEEQHGAGAPGRVP